MAMNVEELGKSLGVGPFSLPPSLPQFALSHPPSSLPSPLLPSLLFLAFVPSFWSFFEFGGFQVLFRNQNALIP